MDGSYRHQRKGDEGELRGRNVYLRSSVYAENEKEEAQRASVKVLLWRNCRKAAARKPLFSRSASVKAFGKKERL